MKIGLVGYPGAGKSTVFGALTGLPAEPGARGGADKARIGTVKVPDARVDALAKLYAPKKKTYAEIAFTDLAGSHGEGLDRSVLNAMRPLDALCQVVRAFPDAAGRAADPLGEIGGLATETILADLEIVETRRKKLAKDPAGAKELPLLERIQDALEAEQAIRELALTADEKKALSGYTFLSQKPLLLVLNVAEEDVAQPAPEPVAAAARARGLGLVVLSASVEWDIAQMAEAEQAEFLASLGVAESAKSRFVRAAYELLDLVSMLTAGEDECRAWPVPRGTPAPRAAGKIHSDIERGFIRAEVVPWQDLVELGSEAKCRDAGKLRVEGKSYVIQDGDVVNFRFNV
ncbi:MAG: redox-regulated ATPase YchF [Proteobacteria bacterium]|nr:MAG: redox-regulated ATPase YchF [Pseudomonadota bacterium]